MYRTETCIFGHLLSYFSTLHIQDIELAESLCGFRKIITTLDKRQLVITSHAGDVVKHGKYHV